MTFDNLLKNNLIEVTEYDNCLVRLGSYLNKDFKRLIGESDIYRLTYKQALKAFNANPERVTALIEENGFTYKSR